ncbi:MAG: hypothetical protein H7Y07_04410 [Pyrinomonadaceae bacterium]|nr:hypothetical protein [Sphingobacteriaceae bacterium]
MKKCIVIIINCLLIIYLSACKKPADAEVDTKTTVDPLISSSTWERKGIIPYSYQNLGFAGFNSMQPVELLKVGADIQVLYSENYQLSGVDGRQFYKAKYALYTNDAAQITKISLPSGTNVSTGEYYQYFVPDSYNTGALKYSKNGTDTYLGVINEAGQQLGSHVIGHPSRVASVYSNGDVLSGSIDYSNYAELDFYNKASNSWTYIKGTSHDSTTLIGYTPFRLPDGSLTAFNITYKGSQLYFSIASPVLSPAPNTPRYHSQFLQPMALFDNNFLTGYNPQIISSTLNANTFTVVIGTCLYGTQNINKIFAYSWTKGSTTFKELYRAIPIETAHSVKLLSASTKCKSDGTVYIWVENTDGQGGSMLMIDSYGAHYNLSSITYPAGMKVGGLKFIDDNYFALVYPTTDSNDSKKDLRMEIIMLKH